MDWGYIVFIGVHFLGDYQDMYKQFINLLPHINCYENVVIGGDFNNGKIYGDKNMISLIIIITGLNMFKRS